MLVTSIGGSWVSAVTGAAEQLLARWEDVGWGWVWVSTSTWCGFLLSRGGEAAGRWFLSSPCGQALYLKDKRSSLCPAKGRAVPLLPEALRAEPVLSFPLCPVEMCRFYTCLFQRCDSRAMIVEVFHAGWASSFTSSTFRTQLCQVRGSFIFSGTCNGEKETLLTSGCTMWWMPRTVAQQKRVTAWFWQCLFWEEGKMRGAMVLL